jgi:hypothetical protein
MNGKCRMASMVVLAALGLCYLGAMPAVAQEPAPAAGAAGAPAGQQKYTMAEYNAYQAAAAEKDPNAKIKLLDDFASKYPNSALLNYIYPLYYQAYAELKNWPKVIEYADKEIGLGTKLTPNERYQAYSARAFAYNNLQNPDAAQAKAEYQAALDGIKSLDALPKPDGMDDAKFAEEKKKTALSLETTAANAAMAGKDYPDAIAAYKTVLVSNPDDFITNYFLGRAYAAMTPPQTLDAMWSFARAASSKNANEKQSKQVKDYLRSTVIPKYQGGTVCDPLTDAEFNELLQLASSSVDRPASYKIPSAADLDAVRKDMTIASVVTDLKAGGEKAKLTWAAACGLEFPEVPTKVLEVSGGPDPAQLKGAFVTSEAEFDAATTPNMDFKIVGQPEAAKLEKDAFVHITGTLMSYDPDPNFMLHWDKAKVKEDDLPKEKTPAKKPVPKKPAAKKPS